MKSAPEMFWSSGRCAEDKEDKKPWKELFFWNCRVSVVQWTRVARRVCLVYTW